MKRAQKKVSSKKWWYVSGTILLLLAGVAGGVYYHHYEYSPVTYKFADGSSVSVSRHNLNQMTPAQKQTFLHPVNETVLHPCTGNTQDQCLVTTSVDLWPSGESATRQVASKQYEGQPNEIMGRLVSNTGSTLQIKTTSGRIISVTHPLDVISDFNTNRSKDYGFAINNGDEIYVSYSGAMQDDTIKSDQIIQSLLLMNGNPKTGPMSKY